MIIYNVTINVDKDIYPEWLQWMKQVHIPEVMATGCFHEYKICKLLGGDEETGLNIAVQYIAYDMMHYERYKNEFATALQQKTTLKYRDKLAAFRTLLEVLS